MATQLINLNEIYIDEDFNCRGVISDADVFELANSFQESGQLQAVTVVPCEINGYKYKLIAGFRRCKAAAMLKWEQIEANVHATQDEMRQRIINLAENVQRKELTFMQEARALGHFLDNCFGEETIMGILGKSRGWVQTRKMAWALPEIIHTEIDLGNITIENIRELYTIHQSGTQEELFKAVKWIKEDKSKGGRGSLKEKKTKALAARAPKIRNMSEINSMQDRIIALTNNNEDAINKTLAWVAGRINEDDFEQGLMEYCENMGYEYKPRSWV